MYRTIESFVQEWKQEANSTQKMMNALTDQSLQQEVAPGHRTLGQIAWHIVTTLHEILSRTGLEFEAATDASEVPASAQLIAQSYQEASKNLLAAIQKQWTDESLTVASDMYGEQWMNGLTLAITNHHQIHHRGQMTILMRQAGLKVPGMYGPSFEEWTMPTN
jgi:uncharacterized damage-inducible protein DinB